MTKLNLGSGSNRLQDDFINVDLHTDADLQHDLRTPLPFADNTVDEIYSCHVIEHFTRKEWEFVRQDWARVLKPGATIEIRCPDIVKLAEHVLSTDTLPLRIQQIYGQQAHEGEFHKNGFTEQILVDSFPGFTAVLLKPSTDYELHMKLRKP